MWGNLNDYWLSRTMIIMCIENSKLLVWELEWEPHKQIYAYIDCWFMKKSFAEQWGVKYAETNEYQYKTWKLFSTSYIHEK